VTAETFGRPGVVDYRNQILAEAMRVPGLVQRFGFGIAMARRELRENRHPEPEFVVEPTRVHCTVRRR
jgi:ATP-dependent DNA helicase RecG